MVVCGESTAANNISLMHVMTPGNFHLFFAAASYT
jgi:hypothetical protein